MSLLPSHKSKFDKKLDKFFGIELDSLDISIINTLAMSCPVSLLPVLAKSFDVDINGLDEKSARKLIHNALEIHKLAGTFWAIKKRVESIDSNALIIEGNLSQVRDGSFKRDSSRRHGSNSHWAEYSIILSKPLTIKETQSLRGVCDSVAPVRCILKNIDFRSKTFLHNNEHRRNATITRGGYKWLI